MEPIKLHGDQREHSSARQRERRASLFALAVLTGTSVAAIGLLYLLYQ